MAGYSGTPLNKKLSIEAGIKLHFKNAPAHYFDLIAPIPPTVQINTRLTKHIDLIHFFTTSRRELSREIGRLAARLQPDGMLWGSWLKKSSKVPTDVTEDVLREITLPTGLVDLKAYAVDSVWSGLKFVVRKELRADFPDLLQL